jgi:hypothetical protein
MLLLALGLPMAVCSPAQAASTKYLWATINSCDSEASSVGLRASMPGNATDQRMYMRFEVQWRKADFTWGPTGASTRWNRVGSARRRSIQSGFNFVFAPPASGGSYKLRGKVDFRWTAKRKKRWKVVRQVTRTTQAGVPGVEGGRPAGRSDASCLIQR